jgi:hypothetical protein
MRYVAATMLVAALSVQAAPTTLTGKDVVGQCYYKPQGDDQKTILAIDIKSADGRVNTTQYVRLWKDYSREATDIEEKMILYTTAPKETRGVNYMRWSYRSTSTKPPEQWVYLPELQKVRRVSQRDPYDMTWGLTDEDFRVRLIDEDQHDLISTEKVEGRTVYVVESRPKGDSVYSRWVTRFGTPDDWSNCTREEVSYYNRNDKLLKTVSYRWRRFGDAWVWDEVTINNNEALTIVTYRNVEAAVNVGLSDKDFTERELKRGPR